VSEILGVNKRYYPSQMNPEDPPATVVVLLAGSIGDYAAYCGHGQPEWVARFGDKISFAEACCHFPGGQLEEAHYRV